MGLYEVLDQWLLDGARSREENRKRYTSRFDSTSSLR